MKARPIVRLRRTIMFLLVMIGLGGQWCEAAGQARAQLPRTNLLTFLRTMDTTRLRAGTAFELDPQWVGSVTQVYVRETNWALKAEPPRDIRFSHLLVQTNKFKGRIEVRVIRRRVNAQGALGGYNGGEAPCFTNTLPTATAVSEAKNLDDLLKLFGPQDDWTDGWGSGERMYWTESWTRFTAEGSNQLRYLSVFAMVSAEKLGQRADIDHLTVREGLFRPANPDSAEERRQFNTGGEAFAERNTARVRAREKYPLPLRELVAARETPDDSELLAYYRALNEVRKNPSPELFRQFAEWVDERTCEIKMMLDDVLFLNHRKLEKWTDAQHTVALRALTAALPDVKTTMALDDLLVFLLQAHGGGVLKIDVPGTKAIVDLKADRFADGTGASFSENSQNITPENLIIVAQHCQRALREKYPDLQ